MTSQEIKRRIATALMGFELGLHGHILTQAEHMTVPWPADVPVHFTENRRAAVQMEAAINERGLVSSTP